MNRRFPLPLIASVILSGCALAPGMSFSGALPSDESGFSTVSYSSQASEAERFKVQPITPQLVLSQSQARNGPKVGRANPALIQQIAQYRYRVQPRDVLSIVIWGDPVETSSFTAIGSVGNSAAANGQGVPFKVNPDGTIYFPYVGSVEVAGKTTEEIRADIARLMIPYLNNPQITVDVAQFVSQKYQLLGAVVKPGLYPVTDVPVTVSQAISAAGGVITQVPNTITTGNTIPRPLGDLSRVLYVHDGAASVLNLRALTRFGDTSQDRLISPGDVIDVPDNSVEQVHLIGEVAHPGNYPFDNGELNLAQLLGDAGGLSLETADAARVFVFRGAYEKPQIYWLDARSPDSMLLANGFELQPQDVVYVATAGLVTWDRIITQILPTVQTLYETKVLVNP
jgi:polysaccharide biosynthesis/export protein